MEKWKNGDDNLFFVCLFLYQLYFSEKEGNRIKFSFNSTDAQTAFRNLS